MARPVTLFTGQWADLPLKELAPLARSMGYDGLELACWGDHFDVQEALSNDRYVQDRRDLLERCDFQRLIQNDGIDNGVIVYIPAIEIQEER